MAPKEKNLFTSLYFPGAAGGIYYVNESEAGGVTFNRKWKDYIKTVDINSLKIIKETNLTAMANEDGKDYFNAENFIFKDKKYSFFINRDDKDVYPVYCSIQHIDGSAATALQEIQKVDMSKDKPFASMASPLAGKVTKNQASYSAASYVQIKPAFDNKSIISAMIYETVDKTNSMLNISEWDENMKAIVSNNYKIPFLAHQRSQKTIFGKMGTSGGDMPYVKHFAKDNNGFVYALIQSANPKDEDDENMFWLYQFKLSDPAYIKVFKKEFVKNIATVQAAMWQNESGKIFLSNIGLEIEKDNDKDEHYFVNTAYIGSFNKDGQLENIFSKQLTTEMMYNFDSEKRVDKRGAVNSLRIKNILPDADGGCYVIWQREWSEEATNYKGESGSTYYHSDNLLVQNINKAGKLNWENPVYKSQVRKDNVTGGYSGVSSFVSNNNLYLFYPDDPKNAEKATDDKDVAEFSVVKFGDKDLAGIFMATFNAKGNYTRKYIKWPEDKIGYAVLMHSFKFVGTNEIMATARRIHQGAITLKSEEYTFFKLKF